jgi:hypothetical protein
MASLLARDRDWEFMNKTFDSLEWFWHGLV